MLYFKFILLLNLIEWTNVYFWMRSTSFLSFSVGNIQRDFFEMAFWNKAIVIQIMDEKSVLILPIQSILFLDNSSWRKNGLLIILLLRNQIFLKKFIIYFVDIIKIQ